MAIWQVLRETFLDPQISLLTPHYTQTRFHPPFSTLLLLFSTALSSDLFYIFLTYSLSVYQNVMSFKRVEFYLIQCVPSI